MAKENVKVSIKRTEQLGKPIFDNPEKKYWITKIKFRFPGDEALKLGQFWDKSEAAAQATRDKIKAGIGEGEGSLEIAVDKAGEKADNQGNMHFQVEWPGAAQAAGGGGRPTSGYKGPMFTEDEYLRANDRLTAHFTKVVDGLDPAGNLSPAERVEAIRGYVASALINWSGNIWTPKK